ncbi:unnamed protein product [Onchocerca ochengi]|uniref:GCFC domain-containing protein n=1 Tax=Onchocerca ochengi TaxID=42157 RepID=A0A182E2A7_ONCOC|nr:unnamed protein product [Onchocerca ochengi]
MNYSITLMKHLSPFARLLWDGWMSVMRKTALQWYPRQDPQSMLHVIIISRISAEVDEWNPLTDHIPIHTWLYSWLVGWTYDWMAGSIIGLLDLGWMVGPMVRWLDPWLDG